MQDECLKNTGHAFDVGGMYALSRRSRLTSGGAILSAEDSHAKTSATPALEQVSPALAAACGMSSPASFAWFDRDSCSWRTWQRCLLAGWEMFSGRWPRSGTMRNGVVWTRNGPAFRNEVVIGRFCWPTPRACSAMAATITAHAVAHCEEYFPNLETVIARIYRERAIGKHITPKFCEWLMGFPIGWTALGVSETPSSPKSPSGSDTKS